MRIVSVSIGKPKHAARYCPQFAPNQVCLTVPGLDVHEAYGMGMITASNLVPTLLSAPRAALHGHMQGKATTDIKGTQMLGGTLIVDASGVIRYIHYDRFAGDHPNIPELLSAARALT